MKHKLLRRVLASVMALLLVIGLLPTTFAGGGIKVSADDGNYTTVEYVFESKNLTPFAAKAKADGETELAGTDNYFTLVYSAKTKVDGSNKTFDDAYASEQRVNFGGACSTAKNAIKITTSNPATVKVWWVEGGDDNRQVAILDETGTQVAKTDVTVAKNATCISTLELENAGTYYIGGAENNNYFFKVVVTEKVKVEEPKTYSFETKDFATFDKGAKPDKSEEVVGTEDYFTIIYSAKSKVDTSSKEFADGYTSGVRINFGSKFANEMNGVKFTTKNPASVKIWWVEGGDDNRQMAVMKADGTVVAQTNETLAKNATCISTLELSETGTYFLGGLENNNYIFKVEVTETPSGAVKPERADWAGVAAPSITEVKQNGGNIEVSYTMEIGYDGADMVTVEMLGADGAVIESKPSADSSKPVTFAPSASGSYSFKITAKRADCDDKAGNTTEAFSYVLPLGTPAIESATSTGNGSVNVVWGAVAEAAGYEVYAGEKLVGTTEATEYTVTGLTVGEKYSFTVIAVRGEDKSEASQAVETTVTAEQQQVWGFTRYGSSTDSANNGYEGSANDGRVTVYSEGGKGKIVPNSTDGVAFYYTAVPTDHNFTLRAKVHVDKWKLSNGQEGFGIMAADRLGQNGETNPLWNNQYMAIASKIEYLWNAEKNAVDTTGTKYSMKLGLGVIAKTGVTKDNLAKLEANDTATVQNEFKSVTTTLDTTAAQNGLGAGTYNIVGNAEAAVDGTIAELTDFILEIQKNNTGYFITYYDEAGNVIAQQKNYDPEALNRIDSENVYVGFFASRNARATFTDIQFSTVLASDDTAAEEKPVTYVTPMVNVTSAKVANTESYTFSMNANVDGTVDITLNGAVVSTGTAVKAGTTLDVPMTLTSESNNEIAAVFTPDPNYVPGADMKLANTDPININLTVVRNNSYAALTNIYVAPNGTSSGNGTKENPVDIYTAVKYVQPGQTIVITEGTYLLDSTVRVERGVNGTAEKNIRMVADPVAATRPVFDFQGKCAGMVFGGDYWYFNGFDCTHSQNAQKGIQVSGSHNVLDNINTYHNGNTGLQISRLYSTDTREQWPSYNLILNCTSYGNADAGYEDADGFAAKLTVGDGNVFDGCLAYNNADDGWDLFAKVETGSIGSVTIQNCVAYGNGYLEDGTNAGNGNGFKMGGDSMSGYHKLINSYAFNNKAKGIDSNSCPDIQVSSSISYNNESYNVALYTNNAANTDFAATGIISFKDSNVKSGLTTGEQFKPKGSQDTAKYLADTNYYWDGSKSANSSGAAADVAAWFKTLEFTGITRNEDGTLNLNGFLETTDAVAEGIGARPTGTPSIKVVLDGNTQTPETSGTPETPSGAAAGSSVFSTADSTVTEKVGKDGYVSNDVFTKLINDKKTLVVDVTDENGNVAATFTIDGSTFNSLPDSLFRFNVKFNDYAPASEKAKEILKVEDKDMLVCTFESVGYLNGKVAITVKAEGFAAGTQLKLYYYNEELNTVMDKGQTVTVGEDGKVTFTVDHFSTYVLVKADEAIITAPSTGFDSSASVLMGIIFLAGSIAGACLLRKRRYITK